MSVTPYTCRGGDGGETKCNHEELWGSWKKHALWTHSCAKCAQVYTREGGILMQAREVPLPLTLGHPCSSLPAL